MAMTERILKLTCPCVPIYVENLNVFLEHSYIHLDKSFQVTEHNKAHFCSNHLLLEEAEWPLYPSFLTMYLSASQNKKCLAILLSMSQRYI